MALHEIRKLNRTVKQTAERICRQESPEEPADADSRHVRIWKSAELMSKQFDIIEILANEDLTKLPLDTEISVYRAFDKCVRIFQPASDPGRIKIETGHHSRYDPIIRACDKTFTILATVLIENALKYALPNTPIVVRVEPDGKSCIVKVSNYANAKKELDESIFERGVRGTNDTDGSGNGLYVAQMVAEQHNSRIQLEVSDPVNGKVIHSFTMRFETIRHG
jgi:light-regulated signal transduction histidine kinase (bacteriophytochrome)